MGFFDFLIPDALLSPEALKAREKERKRRREHAETMAQIRQGGRTDRVSERQGGKTDRVNARQGGRSDRVATRQGAQTERLTIRGEYGMADPGMVALGIGTDVAGMTASTLGSLGVLPGGQALGRGLVDLIDDDDDPNTPPVPVQRQSPNAGLLQVATDNPGVTAAAGLGLLSLLYVVTRGMK